MGELNICYSSHSSLQRSITSIWTACQALCFIHAAFTYTQKHSVHSHTIIQMSSTKGSSLLVYIDISCKSHCQAPHNASWIASIVPCPTFFDLHWHSFNLQISLLKMTAIFLERKKWDPCTLPCIARITWCCSLPNLSFLHFFPSFLW